MSFDRFDLVLVGFIDGTWPAFELSVRCGLACERAAGENDLPDIDRLVQAAAVAFRRGRRLIAGEELRAWLAERGLSTVGWIAYLRRSVLRRRAPEPLDSILARHPVAVGDVAAILEAEVLFDGILERCGTTLMGWAAASSRVVQASAQHEAADLGRIESIADELATSAAGRLLDVSRECLETRLGRLLPLQAGYERFVDHVSSDAALRGYLEEHRLPWMQFRCTELRFTGHEAASEAVMCLREDGLAPRKVATLAGAELRDLSIELEAAEPSLAARLVAAKPLGVVGPLPDDGGRSRLLVITERVVPSAEDPNLLDRARTEVVRAAVESLTAGMVQWHGAL